MRRNTRVEGWRLEAGGRLFLQPPASGLLPAISRLRPTASRLLLAITLWAAVGGGFANGEEPFQAFLDGLRRRELFDPALAYLGQMRTSPLASAEQKAVIPFEEAATLLDQARSESSRDPTQQLKQLDLAAQRFKEFIAANPDHVLAGGATSQLGSVLVERARTLVRMAGRAQDDSKKAQLLADARSLFAEAETSLTEAAARLETRLKSQAGITDDKQLIKARKQTEADLAQTRLISATVPYEQAQAHPPGSDEAKQLLQQSADRLQGVYEKYSNVLAGLYARMYQGRCLQDLGDTRKALRQYIDLLALPDESEHNRAIKQRVLPLAMQCWLSESEDRPAEAAKRGSQWLEAARGAEAQSAAALEIRWLTTQALRTQMSALDPTKETEKEPHEKLRKEYLKHLQIVAKTPGERQPTARQALAEAGTLDPVDAAQPTTFAEAKDRANEALGRWQMGTRLIRQVQEQGDQTAIAEQQREIDEAIDEALAMLRLAIGLKDAETPIEDLAGIHDSLAFVHLQRGELYDAAVLGEFVTRRFDDSPIAPHAGAVALAAWTQAYQAVAPNQPRDFQRDRLIALARRLSQKWPGSPESEEGLLTAARLLIIERRLDDALELLNQVAADSANRPAADLLAGPTLWARYDEASRRPEGERRPQAEIDELLNQAQAALERGTAAVRKSIGAGGSATFDLLNAELKLSQVHLARGNFAEAARLLEIPQTGLLDLVSSKNEVTDRGNFAVQVYSTALRAHVGAQDLDKADKVMNSLDAVSAGSDAAAVTQIYVGLGRNLQQEMERLRNERKLDELTKVRASFKAFLDRVAGREQGNTYQSLLWAGESLRNLGAGGSSDPQAPVDAEGRGYYEQAAIAYRRILDEAKSNPQFVPNPESLIVVRVRLAESLRIAGKHAEALDLLVAVLTERPNTLEAQRDAALTYQLWAAENPSYFANAMFGGRKAKKANGREVNVVWGWNELARVAQRFPKYQSLYHESRYSLAWCRVRQAQVGKLDAAKKATELKKAEADIRFTAQLDPSLGGEPWYSKYDALMRQIQGLTRQSETGVKAILDSAKATGATTTSGGR